MRVLHKQHRNRGPVPQCMPETAATPVRAQYDQFGIPGPGLFDDEIGDTGRSRGEKQRLHHDAGRRRALPPLLQDLLTSLFHQRDQIRAATHEFTTAMGVLQCIDNVHEPQRRAVERAKADGLVQSSLRGCAAIHGNKNS